MNEAFITLTIPVKKSIALIAHDSKKHELIEWCRANKDILAKHDLCGTGTTARMITDQTGLSVKGYKATADFMITSPYMDKEYDHEVINFRRNIEERAETL